MPSFRRQRLFESRKQQKRKVASQQIAKILELALEQNPKRPDIAERRADSAWKMSTRFNVRLGQSRLLFCHKCKEFIVPPNSARYRLGKRGKTLNITCLRCGNTYRKKFSQK